MSAMILWLNCWTTNVFSWRLSFFCEYEFISFFMFFNTLLSDTMMSIKKSNDIFYIHLPVSLLYATNLELDPVVQSIVSLTISLRHKLVKQISAKVTNTRLVFVEKM